MKRTLFLFLLALSSLPVRSQDFSLWNQEILSKANTGLSTTYLTDEEKKVLLLVNLARLDGKAFIKNVLDPFVEETKPDNNSYLKSLYADLRTTSGLAALAPHQKLSEGTAYHANDMGKKGDTGHNSSDGTDCFVRIKRFYKGGYMAENCSYGYGDALNIVMQLLIDDGVSSKGHRYNILGKPYKQIGISIRPHKVYSYNCVMDFSD